jgi:hypothetical protein
MDRQCLEVELEIGKRVKYTFPVGVRAGEYDADHYNLPNIDRSIPDSVKRSRDFRLALSASDLRHWADPISNSILSKSANVNNSFVRLYLNMELGDLGTRQNSQNTPATFDDIEIDLRADPSSVAAVFTRYGCPLPTRRLNIISRHDILNPSMVMHKSLVDIYRQIPRVLLVVNLDGLVNPELVRMLDTARSLSIESRTTYDVARKLKRLRLTIDLEDTKPAIRVRIPKGSTGTTLLTGAHPFSQLPPSYKPKEVSKAIALCLFDIGGKAVEYKVDIGISPLAREYRGGRPRKIDVLYRIAKDLQSVIEGEIAALGGDIGRM